MHPSSRPCRLIAILFLLFIVIFTPVAQAAGRYALVIGNSKYRHAPSLPNPRNDAEDIAQMLGRMGFTVYLGLDVTRSEMESHIQAFSDNLLGADIALFFYAGHGANVGGRNYLIPVDATLDTERDVERGLVDLDLIQTRMEMSAESSVLLIDACRNNPLTTAQSTAAANSKRKIGLVHYSGRNMGTVISYSTQPGQVASDGEGRNSPYASALLKYLPQRNQELRTLLATVRDEVSRTTNQSQVPWDQSAAVAPLALGPITDAVGKPVIYRGGPLSDKAIGIFMSYALKLLPKRFTKPDGTVVVIDTERQEKILPTLDIARDVVFAARRSAYAANCSLPDLQTSNFRALMDNIQRNGPITDQEFVYLSQLHLVLTLLLTGKLRIADENGPAQPLPPVECPPVVREVVAGRIEAYVARSRAGARGALDRP